MRDGALWLPWCRVEGCEGNHVEPSELPELRIRSGEFVGDWQLKLLKREYQKGKRYRERELCRYAKIYP